MFCGECGKEIPAGANHCPSCGTPVIAAQAQNAPEMQAAPAGIPAQGGDTEQARPYAPRYEETAPQQAPPYAGGGASVPDYEGAEKQGKKKSPVIAIVAVLVVLLIAGGGIFVWKGLPAIRLSSALKAGNEALDAGDYALAEESFQNALTISPDNADAKSGLIGTYETQAAALVKKNKYEEAVAVYEKLQKADPKNRKAEKGISEAYLGWADAIAETEGVEALFTFMEDAEDKLAEEDLAAIRSKCATLLDGELEEMMANGDFDDALSFINRAVEDFGMAEMAERKEGFLADAEEMMAAFMTEMEAGNYEAIHDYDNSPEAAELNSQLRLTGRTSFLYGKDGAGKNLSGTGAGLYLTENGYYFYYGDLVNGSREGNGISIWKISMQDFEMYEGPFSGDKPNGAGTTTIHYDTSIRRTTKATYKDGHEDGDVTVTFDILDDSMSQDQYTFRYTAKGGEAESLPEDVLEWLTNTANNTNASRAQTQLNSGMIIYGISEGYSPETGYFWLSYDPATEYLGTVGYKYK